MDLLLLVELVVFIPSLSLGLLGDFLFFFSFTSFKV